MQNSDLLRELLKALDDMSYFALYPSSQLRTVLSDASTDGDRIRAILRDRDVQEYLFPDFKEKQGKILDPRAHYISLRRKGIIVGR
jgi:hypothetical protein